MAGRRSDINCPPKKRQCVRHKSTNEGNVSDVEFVDVEADVATNNNEDVRVERTAPESSDGSSGSDDSSSEDSTDEDKTVKKNKSKESRENKKTNDDKAGTSQTEQQMCQDNTVGSTQDNDNKNFYRKSRHTFQAARTTPLPDGWQQEKHRSGLPVYLHESSSVCTLSRPYSLHTGSVRDHEIPSDTAPCASCRAILNGEECDESDQGEEDELVNETISQTSSDSESDEEPEPPNKQPKNVKRR